MAAYVAPDQPFAHSEKIRWSELGDTPQVLGIVRDNAVCMRLMTTLALGR